MANNGLKKLICSLILLCAGAIFAWGLACGILAYIYYNLSYGNIFFYIIIIMIILRVIFYNKYTAVTAAAVTAAGILLFIYNINIEPDLAGIILRAWDFIYRIILYIGGYEAYNQVYETAVTLMLSGIVAIFVFIFASRRSGFYILTGLTAGTYGIILSSGGFVYGLPFTACVTGLLMLLARHLHADGKFNIYRPAETAGITAVILLCAGISHLLPVPEQGFVGAALDAVIYKPFNSVNKYLSSFFAPKYFTLSSAGYMRRDNILGGDIYLTDDIVMEITSKNMGRIYLAGAYKDKYTGFSWENTLSGESPYPYGEPDTALLERMFANILISLWIGEFEHLVMMLDDSSVFRNSMHSGRSEYIPDGVLTIQMQKNVYDIREAGINFIKAKTFTAFQFEMTMGMRKDTSPVTITKDRADNMTASRLLERNSPYNLYYRIDAGVGGFAQIENLSRRGVYREIYDELQRLREKYNFDKRQITALLDESLSEEPGNMHMLKMYPPGENYFNPEVSVIYEDFLVEVLIPRADEIYINYTGLPENLPKRVVDLAFELIEKAENDIDKALTISRFLRNYPYTTTPGDTPENRDFVDYFLFDLQEGYCTYFATAFVVMCRAVGIPARYAEGYVTPPVKNDNDIYEVTNRQGHAWAEIYLEGYGWRRVEPTPSADSAGRLSLLPASENYPLINADTGDVITVGLLSEDLSDTVQIFEISEDENIPAIVLMFENSYRNNLFNIISFNLIIAVLPVLAAFILYIITRFLLRRAAVRKINRKANNEAVLEYYKIIMKYLRFFDYKKDDCETVIQFAKRIDGEIAGMNDTAIILSKACYGYTQIDSDERDTVKNMINYLDKKILGSAGRIKYLFYILFK